MWTAELIREIQEITRIVGGTSRRWFLPIASRTLRGLFGPFRYLEMYKNVSVRSPSRSPSKTHDTIEFRYATKQISTVIRD